MSEHKKNEKSIFKVSTTTTQLYSRSKLEAKVGDFRKIFIQDQIDPAFEIENLETGTKVSINQYSILKKLCYDLCAFDALILKEIEVLILSKTAFKIQSDCLAMLKRSTNRENLIGTYIVDANQQRIQDSSSLGDGWFKELNNQEDVESMMTLMKLILQNWDELSTIMSSTYEIDISKACEKFLIKKDTLFQKAWDDTIIPFLVKNL